MESRGAELIIPRGARELVGKKNEDRSEPRSTMTRFVTTSAVSVVCCQMTRCWETPVVYCKQWVPVQVSFCLHILYVLRIPQTSGLDIDMRSDIRGQKGQRKSGRNREEKRDEDTPRKQEKPRKSAHVTVGGSAHQSRLGTSRHTCSEGISSDCISFW